MREASVKRFLPRLRRGGGLRLPSPPAWLVEALAHRLERHAAYLPLGLHMHLYKRLEGPTAPARGTGRTKLHRPRAKSDG